MGTPRVLIHHTDIGSGFLQEIVYHFALAEAVPFAKWKLAVVTKKKDDVFIGVTLVRERERHDPMKSSRLKKTLAPSSTTLAVSS